jgi:hypothetical protein
MKHNYDKHVERFENYKNIIEKEEWADRVGFITFF